MISAVEKWYPRSGALARRKSGVERGDIPFPGGYNKPLAKLDQKYHGVAVGQVGHLQRRLQDLHRQNFLKGPVGILCNIISINAENRLLEQLGG